MQKPDPYCKLPSGFAEKMLNWYDRSKRDLPWRKTHDPYAVWVSEIMLQQTRVETVRDYYIRFLAALPGVADLASAPEEKLMKLWQGLGYYSRVRNMAKAAKVIVEKFNGFFPDSFDAIRSLPGIGDYTAGAVSSIAFGLPVPAVDGNVERVLSRIAGKTLDRKTLSALLVPCYPPARCGDFTQSLMELGATVCLPNGVPLCGECPMRNECLAKRNNLTDRLPEKKEKPARKICRMTVFVVMDSAGNILLRKRPETGLLAGLWELPNVEGVLTEPAVAEQFPDHISVERLKEKKHIFTHIEWHMTPWLIRCKHLPDGIPVAELNTAYPLPVAFSKILNF